MVERPSEVTYEQSADLGLNGMIPAAYLEDPGAALMELKQMDEDDLRNDILDDDDLGFDAVKKAEFLAALRSLKDDGTATASDPMTDLAKILGVAPGESSDVESVIHAKDAEIAVLKQQQAAKDEELARVIATKDAELQQLQAQLARLEGVPPQRETDL